MATAVTPQTPTPLVPLERQTLGQRLAALPLRAVMMLGAGTLALAAVAVALALNGSKGDYKVLFSGLADKDGGAIIEQLNQMKVPYRHSDGGGAILVPADKVHDVRMKLGLIGLPKASIGGYELLDAPKFGQTQAGENVAIKRATEGELMRSIGSLAGVQSARVMLAMPQQNGFFREQQKPPASVVVTRNVTSSPGSKVGRSASRTSASGSSIVHWTERDRISTLTMSFVAGVERISAPDTATSRQPRCRSCRSRSTCRTKRARWRASARSGLSSTPGR